MGIIKAAKLAFDYLRYDEDGNVEDTQRAVDGVDLDIQPGEFVAVLGHNGSGKSTFAKHINALLLPTEGTIWIDGIDTAKEPELWKVRQKAGMVFQNPDNQIIGMFRPEYIKRGLESKNLSRSLEDSITVVEPLVPWSLAGVYMTSVLGVPTVQYAPWAVLCYTGVFFAILWGFTGFGIKKITKDSPAYEEYLQLSGKSAEE